MAGEHLQSFASNLTLTFVFGVIGSVLFYIYSRQITLSNAEVLNVEYVGTRAHKYVIKQGRDQFTVYDRESELMKGDKITVYTNLLMPHTYISLRNSSWVFITTGIISLIIAFVHFILHINNIRGMLKND